MALLIR